MNTPIDGNLTFVFIVAGSVLRKGGKFLLVQEKMPNIYGLWNLPAGKVEKGYTIAETAVKETKEESGYDIEIVKEIDVYHQDSDKSVKHAFEAKIIGGELKFPEDEILDARWFTYDEIKKLDKEKKLRANWVIRAIEKSRY